MSIPIAEIPSIHPVDRQYLTSFLDCWLAVCGPETLPGLQFRGSENENEWRYTYLG